MFLRASVGRPATAILFAGLLLAACGSSSSPTAPTAPPAADFASQFDSLWSTFDREYSYFVHKRIDWNALRNTYRPRAIAATDQSGFIAAIRAMLGELHDFHVVIRDPGGATLATYVPDAFVNFDRAVWQQYMARAGYTPGASDWGHGVLDGVPYIYIGGWNTASIRSADFDAALERYRDAPVLILDVRNNGGGNDALAFEIAGRFTRSTVNGGYVRFRNGPAHSDFGPPQQKTLNPRGPWAFGGRVLLLIGRRSASSNESFIEAMRQIPTVTLAGDRTAGGSANPGTFQLANGWSYTVSRWVAYTEDDRVIEDNGILPQTIVPASAADFAAGRDPVIDWALSTARR